MTGKQVRARYTPEQMELARLRAENAQLRMERDIAKKRRRTSRRIRCGVRLDRASEGPLARQRDLPGTGDHSASGYFEWQRRGASCQDGSAGPKRHSDEAFLAHMRGIHAEVKGEYGWSRMHKELLARGIRVGKDRVQRLMQRHGIRARTKRKFVVTTDSRHSLPVAPDLVQRRFTPEAPNLLWSGDITYIATDEGWLYLQSSSICSAGRWWAGA